VRLRDPTDNEAWNEFHEIYRGLVLNYCRRRGLQPWDADDVCQLVMMSLAKTLRSFEYRPARGRFRSYLGRVVGNAITKYGSSRHPRPISLENMVESITGETGPDPDELWEKEWMRNHYRIALRGVRASFDPRSVRIFERRLGGEDPNRIAEDCDLSRDAVRKIIFRIRSRLQEFIAQQIRDEENWTGGGR